MRKNRFPRNGRGTNLGSHNNHVQGRRPYRTDRINHVRGVLGLSRERAIAWLKNQ